MATETWTKTAPPERSWGEAQRSRLNGLLDLDFQLDRASSRTTLIRSAQEPPLRAVRAFEREDGSALVHLHNVSGGVLGGDRLVLRARVGQGASAQLTTTGATRIYRPRSDAAPATQANEILVQEDGLLEYVPDPIIPFAGARFTQRTTIRLAQGAGLFWWDILAPGRLARGELFQYEMIAMATDIVAAGRRVAAERFRLEPAWRDPHSLARMGDFRYLATFYICRVGLTAREWISAEERLREVAKGAARSGETLWGVSALAADGIIVRCLARQGRDASSGLQTIWRMAKRIIFQREIIPPRKLN